MGEEEGEMEKKGWTGRDTWQLVTSVVSGLALLVSLFSVFLNYQLQGSVSLFVTSYTSDYSPRTDSDRYTVSIALTNDGPGQAKDVDFGVVGLDGITRGHAARAIRPLSARESVSGSIKVDAATFMNGLRGDPSTVLSIWVTYTDAVGRAFDVTFPPAKLGSGA